MTKRKGKSDSNVGIKVTDAPSSTGDQHHAAALTAAWHALSARCDGRQDDYQFWFRVFEGHVPKLRARSLRQKYSE
ncbi:MULTISPECIES: hypothetical protein [unclassified Mesorhizobium]|uniref:hypothetical protein n=1 Tax=unclassified Mesorhizobium TaxID=325217 RepID=UPI001CD02955|nr:MULTISPECIES: hypothetical protein [unclassified Mesorhizobium]MBZ9739807.1 hypothetical protein [Mesorhizobium sp. CO1-1-4]MBZ9804929.1 hypothetical protein [Mesorhizobium sp. ES1-6]